MIPIRVMLADDDALMRTTLAEMIAAEESMQVVGTAGDAEEAADLAAKTLPDIAVVDVRMPGGGPRATREIVRRSPRTRVVAFSAAAGRQTAFDMLQAGASGYLVKGDHPSELLAGIRRAALGNVSLSPGIAQNVVEHFARQLQSERTSKDEREGRLERIRLALSGEILSMAYQPIVDLRNRAVLGHEALARFSTQPQQPPNVWFEVAEGLGLRRDLELLALSKALGERAVLPESSFLAVNLSPGTLMAPELVPLITSAVATGLVFEITEHAAVSDYEALRLSLASFHRRGARLAVDDTGSGFASLRHLLELSPEIIKIDLSMTQRLENDGGARALVAGLVTFGRHTGATLIAEGIETEAQRDVLMGLGIVVGQGYLFGRPARLGPRGPKPSAGGVAVAGRPGWRRG